MWPNPQFSTDLVTFTEEIHNGKLHFLSSVELRMLGMHSYFMEYDSYCSKNSDILLFITQQTFVGLKDMS